MCEVANREGSRSASGCACDALSNGDMNDGSIFPDFARINDESCTTDCAAPEEA